MNVILGHWATLWVTQVEFDECLAALRVILQALLGLTGARSLRYVRDYKASNREWLKSDKITFPPYPHNARNGVVVGGIDEAVEFKLHDPNTTTELRSFQHSLPSIELLHSYDYQANRYSAHDDATNFEKQVELTALDSWL